MTNRYIAHITIEADTPLKVGSNSSDFLQDSPIQRDWNGLPMILGTSIAGVLRKDFDENLTDDVFGKDNGSKVIISNALLLDEEKNVNESLLLEKSKFLQIFDNLPIREHTAITEKGVTKEHSKFDEEVVYKGVCFKFSIEILDDKDSFEIILKLLSSPSFRLGGGTTKGFGKLKILEIKTESFNVDNYKEYSSSLNHSLKIEYEIKPLTSSTHATYILKITPDDFFMFGSGFGDKDADQTPVYEKVIDYDKKNDDDSIGGLSDKQILIPASSVKGALSHRTAFHYNKAMLELKKDHTQVNEKNDAVKAIFGHKKEKKLGRKGKILIADCFKTDSNEVKTFDHVSIDRFTGGAIDGALFQEKTIAQKNEWEIEMLLENNIDEVSIDAFEKALDDVCSGMLALGGATTKGHGVFVGKWSKS